MEVLESSISGSAFNKSIIRRCGPPVATSPSTRLGGCTFLQLRTLRHARPTTLQQAISLGRTGEPHRPVLFSPGSSDF